MSESALGYKIAEKSYVRINYRVRVKGGPILKGAAEPEIMDFITGYAQVIPGLEKRLMGLGTGEKMSFTVPPEEAFGPRYDVLVLEKEKKDFHFPEYVKPYVGMELPIILSTEGPDTVIIREIRDDTIVVDANHPLAGASLHYDLEIIEARPARDNEICGEWEEGGATPSCASLDTCGGNCNTITLGGLSNDPITS